MTPGSQITVGVLVELVVTLFINNLPITVVVTPGRVTTFISELREYIGVATNIRGANMIKDASMIRNATTKRDASKMRGINAIMSAKLIATAMCCKSQIICFYPLVSYGQHKQD